MVQAIDVTLNGKRRRVELPPTIGELIRTVSSEIRRSLQWLQSANAKAVLRPISAQTLSNWNVHRNCTKDACSVTGIEHQLRDRDRDLFEHRFAPLLEKSPIKSVNQDCIDGVVWFTAARRLKASLGRIRSVVLPLCTAMLRCHFEGAEILEVIAGGRVAPIHLCTERYFNSWCEAAMDVITAWSTRVGEIDANPTALPMFEFESVSLPLLTAEVELELRQLTNRLRGQLDRPLDAPEESTKGQALMEAVDIPIEKVDEVITGFPGRDTPVPEKFMFPVKGSGSAIARAMGLTGQASYSRVDALREAHANKQCFARQLSPKRYEVWFKNEADAKAVESLLAVQQQPGRS